MTIEIASLEKYQTWTSVDLSPRKRAIDYKWIYRIRYKADRSIYKYKAWLVAKGYTQVKDLNYHETFAPMTKLVTVHCLLAIATIHK